MNTDAFFVEWNGRQVTAYSGECVALVAQYLDENGLHGAIAYANAKDWWTNTAPLTAFNKIVNNPTDYNQVPSHGDIIVWSGNLPGSGGSGHIGIYDAKVSPGVFRSFEQNWGGRQAHFVNHNYDYVLGWYTRKTSAPAQPSGGGDEMITNEAQAHQAYQMLRPNGDGNAAEIAGTAGKRTWQQFADTAQPEIKVRNQILLEQAARMVELTNINNQLSQQITQITNNANSTKAEKDAALAEIAKLQTELTTAMDKLKDAQNQPQVPVQPPVDDESVGAFKKLRDFFRKLLGLK